MSEKTPLEVVIRHQCPQCGAPEKFYCNPQGQVIVCHERWDAEIKAAVEAATKPYREYIAFLEKACGDAEAFRSIHGIQPSDEIIAEGERLRAALEPKP